ncbi:MAG: hypothetical protein KGQ41_00015 [Alphaproteobacteria bacterium]|nr:hypothetical protein [Alphaproteobacteria bacterium]
MLRKTPKTLLIGCQHLTPSTLGLLERFEATGIDPKSMVLIGKCYSTVEGVVAAMHSRGMMAHGGSVPVSAGGYQEAHLRDVANLWQEVFIRLQSGDYDRLVVLDDGGDVIASMPAHVAVPVVAVEQTTNGLLKLKQKSKLSCPVVSVAGSAAKREHEAPFIAGAIADALALRDAVQNVGIVGAGAIGYACAQKLVARFNAVVRVYPEPCADVWKHSVVLGCTGADISPRNGEARSVRYLASGSSGDFEFNTLIKGRPHSFSDMQIGWQVVMNGGYPVNFIRTHEMEAPQEISLTRSLIFEGANYAQTLFGARPAIYELPSDVQYNVVNGWKRYSL